MLLPFFLRAFVCQQESLLPYPDFAFVQIPASSGNSETGESADYSFVEKVNNNLIQRIALDFPVFLQVLIPAQPKKTKFVIGYGVIYTLVKPYYGVFFKTL